MRSLIHFSRRIARDTRGVSAIEFAFLAPGIIAGLLLMVDVGIAVAERMEMDRNVRSGAQAAMSLNNDADAIRDIILASTESPEAMTVSVAMGCFCGATTAVCTALCATGESPSVFVDINASREFAGVVAHHIMPQLTLNSATRVQLR